MNQFSIKKITKSIRELLNNPLILNILLVGGLALLVKIISFFKETLIASNFGLSEFLDTYYIAILIPAFIQNVFIGALKNLFIPNYVTEQKTSKKLGNFQTLTLAAITALIVFLTLLAIIFESFFLELVFSGHNEDYYKMVSKQFYICIPCLFFWGYSSFLSGLLEIKNKFLISSLSGFFVPITTIFCIVFFKTYFGNFAIVWGMTIGSMIGFFFLLLASAYNNVLHFGKISLNNNTRVMLRQYPPKVTSGFLTGINPFVDQFFAAQLVVGSISAIQYGTKIPAFVVGILILAIGNVLLPHFSKIINENINHAYKQLFKFLKITFIGSFIITIITIFFSELIIKLLFERNEFTSDDTAIVATIQQIALIYVPFYLLTLICVKFLTAINENKFMAIVSGWNLIANLILNIILVKYLKVYGLVLSTTIVYTICSFIYVFYSYKLYKKHLNQKS